METNFLTGFGHFCRFVLILIFTIIALNATVAAEVPGTIKDAATAGKMVEFSGGSSKNKKIALKWKLNNAANLKYEIEKSRDGENFATVDSRNITAEKDGEYSWIDGYPKVINCYRLKITDEQGNVSYSKTLVLQMFKTGQVALVGATPDFARNDINVVLESKETVFVTMNITDKDGKLILQNKNNAQEGVNNFTVSNSHALPAGEYVLNVIVNGEDKLAVRLFKN